MSEYRAPRGTAFQQREMDIKTNVTFSIQVCFLSLCTFFLQKKRGYIINRELEFRSQDFNSHL